MDAAALVSSLGVLITAVAGAAVAVIHEVRASRKATARDAASIHEIVNQQRTDMMAEIAALKALVKANGGDPADAV